MRGEKQVKDAGKCLGRYLGVFEDFHEGHGEVQGVVALRIVIDACSGIFETDSSGQHAEYKENQSYRRRYVERPKKGVVSEKSSRLFCP